MVEAFSWVENQIGPQGEDDWSRSPFGWVRQLQSRTRGMAGEMLAERWLSSLGLIVTRAGSAGGDRIVSGVRVEVKFSTPWSGGGFRFSQLRDQDYAYVLLIGVEPQRIRMWIVAKDVILKHSTGQHTGGRATETRWVAFPPDEPPAWLNGCGGDDHTAAARAVALFGSADCPQCQSLLSREPAGRQSEATPTAPTEPVAVAAVGDVVSLPLDAATGRDTVCGHDRSDAPRDPRPDSEVDVLDAVPA